MLKLMYITNDPQTAQIAQQAGVDRIFVDLETVGKEQRQGGMNTVQSHHTVRDVERLRKELTRAALLVRVNPIYPGSEAEIEAVWASGADFVMLPYFQRVGQVRTFLELVRGRAKTVLLFETPEAVRAADEILRLEGIDECYIGLNDLHLGYHQKFLFQPLADGTETRTNLCVPGADGVAKEVSAILGVEAQDVVEMVAVVRCGGDCDKTKDKMDYQGVKSCKAARVFFGGLGSCNFGCIGFGDCEAVCPVNAITVDHSLARVDSAACIGCGMCARTCPTGVITTIPRTAKAVVACHSTAKGAQVRKACTAGCIGCTKCQQVCPNDAIHVTNNLAAVDPDKCTGCGTCVENCPVKCIHLVDNLTQWQAAQQRKAAAG